ncbi:LRR receptor-like serine/threonine-protein kinase GSO1 [Durio zibethinus]|uniref:LRR receptor-like serine/threonine-protein kinase GSO1 n=1 Tax=Durio zibethinus TaxID=66656 RepID=A0A6P5ZMY3_DURZI|nr:LRR receptor-like serine/threonine-protein kinase GSO1 [Durio zibethinus]
MARRKMQQQNWSCHRASPRKLFLGGKIKPSLLHLKHLTYLNLADNSFCENEIPKFFGMLNNLRYLNLSHSCFAGEIPPQLGNLSALKILDLSWNSGLHAKNLLWLSSFSSLEYLNLETVNLFDVGGYWSKAVNMLPSLVSLYLYHCHLTSLDLTLPSVNLTSLEVLNLFGNSIKSPIPPWFSNLTNLEVLDLRSNNFYGTIPGWFGNLCKLRILRANSNRLEGGIVQFLDRFSACQNNSLEILYLGGNDLEGSLPASLGALKNLQEFDLNTNFFWGSIPASIGNLSSLRFLELSDNNLNGTIPESFGKLAELSILSLVGNQMEGVLTETHLANLTKLDSLRLTTYPNRSLIFNVKYDWVPPFRLTVLLLINCQVGPSFPVWLQIQSNLFYVIISNAGISDTIEEEWFARLFSRCWQIDLSNNTIKAKLPTQLYSTNLDIVDLSRNRFEGQIPFWLTNATQLYLQRNLFSGSIPENIGEQMPQLEHCFFLGTR